MAQYTLIIEIPNAGNQQFRYNLNLTRQAEDFPQDYFKKQENRDKLRVDIENQSARQISEIDLDFLIKQWCRDIQQGLKTTNLRRDLTTIAPSKYPTPKQPIPQKRTNTFSGSKTPNLSKTSTQNQNKNQEYPHTEKWSICEQADF